MKAIEINSKTDFLEKDEEAIWMKFLSNNPAFDFLKDPKEDIYSLKDGEPFND